MKIEININKIKQHQYNKCGNPKKKHRCTLAVQQ